MWSLSICMILGLFNNRIISMSELPYMYFAAQFRYPNRCPDGIFVGLLECIGSVDNPNSLSGELHGMWTVCGCHHWIRRVAHGMRMTSQQLVLVQSIDDCWWNILISFFIPIPIPSQLISNSIYSIIYDRVVGFICFIIYIRRPIIDVAQSTAIGGNYFDALFLIDNEHDHSPPPHLAQDSARSFANTFSATPTRMHSVVHQWERSIRSCEWSLPPPPYASDLSHHPNLHYMVDQQNR